MFLNPLLCLKKITVSHYLMIQIVHEKYLNII